MAPRPPSLTLAKSAGPTAPRLGREAGEALVRTGGLAALRAALPAGGELDDRADGWTLFWLGYAHQFEDLARARDLWLQAEQLFESADDAQGLELAACGLLQAVLLDNQDYDGFDTRAGRVVAMPLIDAEPTAPLAVFCDVARLLLAPQRSDASSAARAAVARAFSLIESPLDAELRLRLAIASLHTLGLELDRVRGDDFLVAGAAIAALPKVGGYGRGLWHLFVAESRFYDGAWAERLQVELDAAVDAALSVGARAIQARAWLLRAALALGQGDLAAGAQALDTAHPLLEPRYARDYTLFHFFKSRLALQRGEAESALAHVELGLAKAAQAHAPESAFTPVIMQSGFVLTALGRCQEAASAFARAGDLSSGAQATPCLCHVHLTRALAHWRTGSFAEARAELLAGFAQARSIDMIAFFRALPKVAAELCDASLELDADAEFARKAITTRTLTCPDPGSARWPWPLQIRTLGTLAVERNGEPLRFGRKAPKRLLDLLRLIVALGARQVDTSRLASILWPEAEGDRDRESLKAMLHRARSLLGDDAIIVRDGQVSFDEEIVWVDTWAFEHVASRIETLIGSTAAARSVDDGELDRRRLQLMSLYRGHFLGQTEVPPWGLALRDRLRARFIRSVDALGQRMEACGRQDDAIALYLSALEHDNLAEEFYQRLIACHIARGEMAQALNAYRRCRELLSIVLGLKPSARTESLASRIRAP